METPPKISRQRDSVHQKDGSVIQGTAQGVLPNGDLMLQDQQKKLQHLSFYMVEEIKIKTS